MISDDFIENVITLQSEQENADMIYREFHGMEAVAKFEEGTHKQDENHE